MHYTHDHPNTLLSETQEKIFSSRIFEKFQILLQDLIFAVGILLIPTEFTYPLFRIYVS